MELREFTLKKSEVKVENYEVVLLCESLETFDEELNGLHFHSTEIVKNNPVMLVDVRKNPENKTLVFVYKRISPSGTFKKLADGISIGKLLIL